MGPPPVTKNQKTGEKWVLQKCNTSGYPFGDKSRERMYLWKEKFKKSLPQDIYDIAEKHGEGEWLQEMKTYISIKKQVYNELAAMSPKYYWRIKEIGIEDLSNFFSLALSHNQSFYYVLTILQDVVNNANYHIDHNEGEKSFTLTDLYYAKIILRYLTQTYLTVKWVQSGMMKTLYPEVVLNFFLQWTDTSHMHSDEEVDNSLNNLYEEVEKMFPNVESVQHKSLYDKIYNFAIQERDVLMAISDVIYNKRRLAVMTSANLDTLDIVKAIKNKCGNMITAATVFTGVASRCGIVCKLVAFPNHMFLEWREPSDSRLYKIELDSGLIQPRGRCPFSRHYMMEEYNYCPDSLLQFIVSSFLMTMGSLRDSATQNAAYLSDFLGTNPSDNNPYRHFLPYLLEYDHVPMLTQPLELKNMRNEHREIIKSLSTLNQPRQALIKEVSFVSLFGLLYSHSSTWAIEAGFEDKPVVNLRDNVVTYAVGMVCYHKKYDYLCVIRGWDLTCSAEWRRRIEFKTLTYGSKQPFYCVIAVDQSERYVAQENLVDVARPTRLYHLEDVIAKEFTHFDGYSYMPNKEKQKEFPNDGPVRQYFKNLYNQRHLEQSFEN